TMPCIGAERGSKLGVSENAKNSVPTRRPGDDIDVQNARSARAPLRRGNHDGNRNLDIASVERIALGMARGCKVCAEQSHASYAANVARRASCSLRIRATGPIALRNLRPT